MESPRAEISGTWGPAITWKFIEATIVPDEALVTAVFCVAIHQGDLILTVTDRGYLEPLGGHVEIGESVLDALHREALEEGGVRIQSARLFGYREIRNSQQVINKATGNPYPSIGYNAFYLVETDLALEAFTGVEISRVERVPFTAEGLRALVAPELPIFNRALEIYRRAARG